MRLQDPQHHPHSYSAQETCGTKTAHKSDKMPDLNTVHASPRNPTSHPQPTAAQPVSATASAQASRHSSTPASRRASQICEYDFCSRVLDIGTSGSYMLSSTNYIVRHSPRNITTDHITTRSITRSEKIIQLHSSYSKPSAAYSNTLSSFKPRSC